MDHALAPLFFSDTLSTMFKTLLSGATCVCLLTGTSAAAPQVIQPSFAASVHDEPVDGLGDSFNNTPFEGLIRTQSTRADRAIQEYDVSSLSGQSIQSATLSGRVSVNNAFDNGVRTFDFLLFDGNGVADLSDYQISATVVGSDQYHPPMDTTFTYQFDVTAEVQALLLGGSSFIGLRVEGTSSPNFPNILVTSDCVLDITPGTGPQVTLFCSGDGTGTPCPCGNIGGADAGCGNSGSANGGSIGFLGAPSVGAGNFQLTGTGIVPGTPGLYFEGTAQQNGGLGSLFGDGLRCAAGAVTRLQVVVGSASGTSMSTVDIPSASGVTAGETRHYQLWFRDPTNGPCNTGFNTTNAMAVTWTP